MDRHHKVSTADVKVRRTHDATPMAAKTDGFLTRGVDGKLYRFRVVREGVYRLTREGE